MSRMPAQVGEQIGSWRLERLLGEGGMSVVYLGRHAWLAQDGAVKMLRPEYCRDPQSLQRFEQEALTAGQLQHENIIHVQDFGQDRYDRHYMVLELLEGADLESLIDEGPFPVTWISGIVEQICSALSMTHKAGILHRDLKPSNIFLLPREEGEIPLVKLLDFGVAKVLFQEEDKKLTRTGAIIGTPAYLAPEQVIPKDELTISVDIYALGVILYQLFAGVLPIEGSNMIEHAMLILQEAPPLLGTIREELAGSKIEALLVSMLEKHPSQRPGSMTEALQLFREAIAEIDDPLEGTKAYPVLEFEKVAAWSEENSGGREGFVRDTTNFSPVESLTDTTKDGMGEKQRNPGSSLPTGEISLDELEGDGDDDSATFLDGQLGLHLRGAGPNSPASPRPHAQTPEPLSKQRIPKSPQSQTANAPSGKKQMVFFGVLMLFSSLIVAGTVGFVIVRFLSNNTQKHVTPRDTSLGELDRLALEGVKAFKRRKFARAVSLWRRAVRQPGWRKSSYYPKLYRGIGVGLARQNLLYSAVAYYKRYLQAKKQTLKPDDKVQHEQFQKELEQLKGFQKELKAQIDEGFRVLAQIQTSIGEKRWAETQKHVQDVLRVAPSIPEIQQKLAVMLADIFPEVSLKIIRDILANMELDEERTRELKKRELSLKLSIAQRENEVERLLQSSKKLIEANKDRRAKRLFARKLSVRRHLTQHSIHKMFHRWNAGQLRQDFRSGIAFLSIFQHKLEELKRRGLESWMHNQRADFLTAEIIKEQIELLRQLRHQKEILNKANARLKSGKLKESLTYLHAFLEKQGRLNKADRWQLSQILGEGGRRASTLHGKISKAMRLRPAVHRAWQKAQFAKAKALNKELLRLLKDSAAHPFFYKKMRSWSSRAKRAKSHRKRALAFFYRKKWRSARRYFRRYLRAFPKSQDAGLIRKQLKTCRCGIGGVPWENCKNVRR